MMAIQASAAPCSARPETISGRSPIWSASRPARGAISSGATPQGSSLSPASSGPKPRPTCRNCAMKNNAPVVEAFSKKVTALPAEKLRAANRRIGSIGARACSSHRAKATISAAPPASDPATSGLPHPAELPRTSPHTSPRAAPVPSARPGRSRAACGP
jgi:hypothetical protein